MYIKEIISILIVPVLIYLCYRFSFLAIRKFEQKVDESAKHQAENI